MNMRNLGSKERSGVKSKDGIMRQTLFCLKFWFESDCIFVMILSQDGFERDDPETKFHTITS